MKLSNFNFDLPKELLAEYPSENRDEARLMVVHRKTGEIEHKLFKDVIDYLKKDIDEGLKKLSNNDLISFLDGLIIQKRGKKEDGTPVPKIKVTKNNLNNILLRKLRIALAFKSYDMIRIFKLGGIEISEGELSALFRREDHKNYKECGDKYVRVFLKGLTEYCRN